MEKNIHEEKCVIMIIITMIIVIHVYLHSGLTAHSQCGAVHLKYHRHEHFATVS